MKTAVENRQPESRKAKRIILNILLGVSFAILIYAVVMVFFFRSEDAYFLGYKPYIVASESMSPAIEKYALVLVKNGGYDDVKTGDVIAYKADQIGGKSALHRVIDVTSDGLITKGDANKINDERLVTEDSFMGHEVWYTNSTAAIIPMFQTTKGTIIAIMLTLATIIILVIIAKVIKDKLRQRKHGYSEQNDSLDRVF